MKYFFLAIFVLFSAQPFQAVACDMHDAQDTQSQHSSMNSGSMGHDDMQGMDCCDHDDDEQKDGCASMSHCGACAIGLAAVHPSLAETVFGSNSKLFQPVADGVLNRSCSPPFRPPII